MPTLNVNDVDIAYDWHGPSDGPVMLLIMGLGIPSSAWPPEFIEEFTSAGYRVLTFDNRDVGQSQILDNLGIPSPPWAMLRHLLRMRVRAPYDLADMAQDATALLSALNVDGAHVVGASMGGMIAQILALRQPSRVLSLTSIMSSTGERGLPRPRRRVFRYMLKRGRTRSEAALRSYHDGFWPLIESPAHPHTDEELVAFLDRLFARGMSPTGSLRQALAILASPGRAGSLAQLSVPTLVVHGDADPLLPVEHGYATAAAIRDAEIMILEGMGHDLPQALIPQICDAIVGQARVRDTSPTLSGTDAG